MFRKIFIPVNHFDIFIHYHAKKYADSVLVVDDGSIDRTCEVARLAGAEVIQHHRNIGKGAALKTGFEHAGLNGATVIVVLDSDGRYNPELIPRLVAPILAGKADMVNGSRYINGGKKDIPFYHRIGWYFLDKVTNLNSGLHLTDAPNPEYLTWDPFSSQHLIDTYNYHLWDCVKGVPSK